MTNIVKLRVIEAEKSVKGRIFVWLQGETVLQNLEKRAAGVTAFTPQFLRKEVMPKVLARLGLPAGTKLAYSMYAGCTMCPCSPGFIVPEEPLMRHKSVHITVSV